MFNNNQIYRYINESTIYYIVVLSIFLIFLYILYTTYSAQMNVIEGLRVNNDKKDKGKI